MLIRYYFPWEIVLVIIYVTQLFRHSLSAHLLQPKYQSAVDANYQYISPLIIISHALACWLTCGSVRAIRVFDNEGGVTQ